MASWRTVKKVELHRHLEGAVRLQTVMDVAPEAGVTLPTTNLDELKHHALVLEPMEDLATVLAKFSLVQSCLATPAILERVAYENCVDAFSDGIRVLELRYSPSFICDGHRNLNFDTVHVAILKGIERAQKELQPAMAVGLICIISRDQPLNEAEKTTDFAVNHRKTFVGFDLAGPEVGYRSTEFAKFFKKASAAGLGITVHSGEAAVPEAPQFVRESVEYLGATRIGHGVQIVHDKKVVEFVKRNNVVLEVCPTSNVLTKAVRKIEAHPLRELMDMGVRVTLNSDDPHIFGIDLTHEYETMARVHEFTQKDFDHLNMEALRASFIDAKTVQRVWDL